MIAFENSSRIHARIFRVKPEALFSAHTEVDFKCPR